MQMCIELAQKGFGHVSPNPMVGCVIVRNDLLIGQGYHAYYGGPHAEVNAIESVKDKSLIEGSDIYVNLEPCSHFGKTPPCADLLIYHKPKRVIIGMQDPNPLVAGSGIRKLEQAGIEVKIDILKEQCLELNRRFIINIVQKRPYIILKWAETRDAYMSGHIKQISGDSAAKLLHQWRSEEDAFLVGTQTLLTDDPALNTRLVEGKNPIRIAIDMDLKSLKGKFQFYDKKQHSIVINSIKEEKDGNIHYLKVDSRYPREWMSKLLDLKVGSLVVEGGATLLQSFIEADLFDEIRIFKSKSLKMGSGQKSPTLSSFPFIEIDLGEDTFLLHKCTI